MLNFVPVPQVDEPPLPYAEALARLAGMRHALRLVDPFGGGPASDPSDDDELAATWTDSSSKARCFDSRTERTAAAAAAGLEALIGEQAEGRGPNQAASRELADEIRRGLEDVSRLMMRGA